MLETIVEIAEESPVLSVRGSVQNSSSSTDLEADSDPASRLSRTVYYVLGLISCTSAGADFLLEFGWEATLSSTGEPTGLCVPSDPAKLAFVCPSVLNLTVSWELTVCALATLPRYRLGQCKSLVIQAPSTFSRARLL